MATSSCEREVVKSGYLTKSPSSGGRGRLKRRWFVLTSSKPECHPANGASASSSSSFRLDYYEKENHARKGSIDLGARCLMLEDPDYVHHGRKRRQSSLSFNLILRKESTKLKSRREAFASRFQLQACSEEEKHSWLEAFQQCGVSILNAAEREVENAEPTTPTFYVADESTNDDLEDSTTIPSPAIPVPRTSQLMEELSTTVPEGQTFASCDGEDVTLSQLYGRGGERDREHLVNNNRARDRLTSSYEFSHNYSEPMTPTIRIHACSCEDLDSHGEPDQFSGLSVDCRESQESMELFHSSSECLTPSPVPVRRRRRRRERLASDLHELSRQLEFTPYIKMYKQEQVFLSCETLSGGHFGAVHKATLMSTFKQPVLETVSVRVIGSHCPESEATSLLREASVMSQLSHPNVASVLGLVLSEQPKMIVLEYLSEGDLQSYLQGIQSQEQGEREGLPTKLLSYCQQIASGMSYLVDRGCVVMSLTTKCVLLSDKDVCKITGIQCPSYSLSCDQVSPLPMCRDEDSGLFEKDIWSYGTVLYEIWSVGRSPPSAYMNMVPGIRVLLPPPPGCPKSIYKLMMKCWNEESTNKPCWMTINDALKSPNTLQLPEESYDDTLVPSDGLMLGSPLETAVDLYKDIQREYGSSLTAHPYYKHQPKTAQPALPVTLLDQDWTVFCPVERNSLKFCPQELEAHFERLSLSHSEKSPLKPISE